MALYKEKYGKAVTAFPYLIYLHTSGLQAFGLLLECYPKLVLADNTYATALRSFTASKCEPSDERVIDVPLYVCNPFDKI